MYYEDFYDKIVYVPTGQKLCKERRVLLKKLNTDGAYSVETRLLNALIQQKKTDFIKGTIVIFPKGRDYCIPDLETQNFEIYEYTEKNGVAFTSESIGIYIPESDLEAAFIPLIETGYKGYALILNLYKHRGSKNCRRLYKAYF